MAPVFLRSDSEPAHFAGQFLASGLRAGSSAKLDVVAVLPVIQLFDDEGTPGVRVLRSLMKVFTPRKVETLNLDHSSRLPYRSFVKSRPASQNLEDYFFSTFPWI